MRGHELARRYAALFPEYYKSASGIDAARFDVEQFERSAPTGRTWSRSRTSAAPPSR